MLMLELVLKIKSLDYVEWLLLGAIGTILGITLVLVAGVAICFSIAMIV